jgi:hypothetical protein
VTALAIIDDVALALQRDLTSVEEDAAAGLIELASGAVESVTQRLFAPGTYTVTRRVPGLSGALPPRLRLPATVDSLTSVAIIDPRNGSLTTISPDSYTLRNSTIYGLGCYAGQDVEVTFVVTESVPADIVALVAGVVAGRLSLPSAGVTSETTGPYAVTFGNNSGRIYFSASDKAVLRRYRLPGSAIRLG